MNEETRSSIAGFIGLLNMRGRPSDTLSPLWYVLVGIICVTLDTMAAPVIGGGHNCEIDGAYVMGTVLQVTLCPADPAALSDTFARARHYDAMFTTYADDSPVNKLNARAGQGAQPVPDEVADVLKLAQRYAKLTRGAFDVTVRPLLRVWRDAEAVGKPPSPAALASALRVVGSNKIGFPEAGVVILPDRGMALDLGGIGKGYTLDRAAARLREQGVTDALLNFGQSSLWALGRPPSTGGWRLALRRPDGGIAGFVTLVDRALSVSASLGQSRSIAGKSYGHVVDPRTGRPVERDLLVCVIAPSAAQAEALSTALLVLGEGEGLSLIEGLDGVEALLLDANGARWRTAGWQTATFFDDESD